MANRAKSAVMLILVAGSLARIFFMLNDQEALITIVPDDAFYYFQTAENIVNGKGSSFDGIHPTNGYHPLWMVLILPVAALVNDPFVFTRVVLGLGILLSILSALFMYKLLRILADTWWIPLVGLSLFFLNPQSMASSLNGLETSLSNLLFLMSLHFTLAGAVRDRRFKGHEVILGFLLGMLFLARTDNIFFLALLIMVGTIQSPKRSRFQRLCILLSMVMMVGCPWFIVSLLTFGTVVQTSGLALPYVEHERFFLDGSTIPDMLLFSLKTFADFLKVDFFIYLGLPRWLVISATAFCLLVFGAYWKDPEIRNRRDVRQSLMILVILSFGGFVLIFSHAFIRWYTRPWYFNQLIVLAVALFCLSLSVFVSKVQVPLTVERIFRRNSSAYAVVRVILVASGIVILTIQFSDGVKLLLKGGVPWQIEMLDSARWLRANTRKDEVASSFNAGIAGFFSGRRVVNLDGCVNNAAYDALRRKDLLGMMENANVRYYVDYAPFMWEVYLPFAGEAGDRLKVALLQEIDRPSVSWQRSTIKIYRLEWLH